MSDIVSDYFDLQAKVHEHFGYVEDWKVIPLVDHRDMFWILFENEDGTGNIHYYDKKFEDGYDADGQYYDATIYTQRFLPKWVYRANDYTMVCMDTHCDGNQYIGVFTNVKEQLDVSPF